MFVHKMQQCNNFKDPGVQFYGGELFRALQDSADEQRAAGAQASRLAASAHQGTRTSQHGNLFSSRDT
jgi:hypothetical protein